jgi:hypothetical protein
MHPAHVAKTFAAIIILSALQCGVLSGQQSYRTMHGFLKSSRNSPPSPAAMPITRPVPRFRGFNYARKHQPEFVDYFRSRVARTGLAPSTFRPATPMDVPGTLPTVLPGLEFRPTAPAGSLPNAVVTGDFNRDGHLDYVVANGGSGDLYMYFGNGDGTFQLPIVIPLLGTSPVALVAADLRGIGILDLAVVYIDSQTLGILPGNGDGTFGPERESAFPMIDVPVAIAAGDFNGDGKMDLVVGLDEVDSQGFCMSDDAFYVFLGNGMGGFPNSNIIPIPDGCESVNTISVGDINRNGKLDLAINNWAGQSFAEAWLGNGDGTFRFAQGLDRRNWGFITAADLGDVNSDGCMDVVTANEYGLGTVFLGNCDGTFQSPTYPAGSFGIGDFVESMKLADLNGDGHLDVVFAGDYVELVNGMTAGNLVSVAFGDGNGNFGQAHVYRGETNMAGFAVGDFRGGGYPDVVTANQSSDTSSVFLNDGHGGFGDPQGMTVDATSPGIWLPSNFLAMDLNGDGKQDLAAVETPQSTGIYRIAPLMNDGTGHLLPGRSSSTGVDSTDSMWDFVLADFRHTGRPDFLATYGSGPSYVAFLPNNGDGSFGAEQVTQLSATGYSPVIGVGDFNGDGKLDFVAASGLATGSNLQTLSVYLGNGDGTFTPAGTVAYGGTTTYFPTAIFVGDFNRDGKQDVLVWLTYNVVGSQAPLYEFTGKGDGSFNPPQMLFSNISPFTVLDLNHDGWPDLIEEVSTPSGGNPPFLMINIYIGQPDGTFHLTNSYQPYQAEKYVRTPYPVIGDFNGDGNTDVAVTGIAYPAAQQLVTWILMGNGDGSFTPTYDAYPMGKNLLPYNMLAVDLRGTGATDLIEVDSVVNSYNIVRAGRASALQLSLGGNPTDGTLPIGTISVNVPPASAAEVTLTSSDPGVILPASIKVPAGSLTQTFNFTYGPGFNPQRVYSVTATLGADTSTAYGVFTYLAHEAVRASYTLQPGVLSFPSVASGASGSPLSVTLTSTGNSALVLEGFWIDGIPNAFSAQWNCARILYPGASCTILVTFAPQYTGPASAELNIVSNGTLNQLLLAGQSEGIASPVGVSSVSFPGQPVGTTSSAQPVVLQNTSMVSISISSITVSGPFAQTNNCYSSLSGPFSCTINVTFSPTQTGPASGTLTIVAGAIGSPYVIPLSGTGQTPAPVVSPTTLQFNPVAVNSASSPLSVTVTAGQAALTLQSIATTGDFAQTNNCPNSMAAGASCTVSVTFTPTATGARQGTLVLTDNGSGSPQTVPLSGTGLDFTLAPPSGSSTSATISPGQSATYNISLGGSGGTVSFSCVGAPSQSTCTVSPTSVTLGGSATPITVSVSTTAASLGPTRSRPFPLIPPNFLRFTRFLMLLALSLSFLWTAARRLRHGVKSWRHALVPLMGGMLLMLALAACGGGGGGGGGGGPTNPGTPAGTYSLTVTATMPVGSSTITHTITLSLNVT